MGGKFCEGNFVGIDEGFYNSDALRFAYDSRTIFSPDLNSLLSGIVIDIVYVTIDICFVYKKDKCLEILNYLLLMLYSIVLSFFKRTWR